MQQAGTCADSKDSRDGIKESLMFIKATDDLGSIQAISFSAHGIKNLYDRRDPRIHRFEGLEDIFALAHIQNFRIIPSNKNNVCIVG